MRPQKAPLLGLFYALNLALGIFESAPHNHLVPDTIKVGYPVTLHW
jgi:hypothetical protein